MVGDHLRDSAIEEILDRYRAHWTFLPELALAKISLEASLANRSRQVQGLDRDTVERYAEDMKRGDRFPPIIVRRVGRGATERFIAVGGNHRIVAAHESGREIMPAYEVVCEPELLTLIMFEDNRRHGLPPNEEERLAQGLTLVEGFGYTQEEAAKVVGISKQKIGRHIQTKDGERRASQLGIKDFDKIVSSSRWRLSGIKSDPVLTIAAELVRDYEPSTEDVYVMVTSVNKVRSETEAIKMLADYETDWKSRYHRKHGGKATQHSDFQKLRSAMTQALSIDTDRVVRGITTAEQKRNLRSRLKQTIEHLQDIEKATR